MQPVRIPTQQDEPAWFLSFRTDEIIPALLVFALGMVTRHLTLGMFAAWIFFKIYAKLRTRFPRGYLIHWAYGHNLWVFSASRSMSDPYARRFISNQITPQMDLKKFRLKKDAGATCIYVYGFYFCLSNKTAPNFTLFVSSLNI